MLGKKGSLGFMAIKVDLAKAYDRVEWSILCQMLYRYGFSPKIIALIQECISTTQFSILLKGSPFGLFKVERGICQGDPMSPALFTIFSDLLSRILATTGHEYCISGIKISKTSPRITHLMYVDDLVIYCKV